MSTDTPEYCCKNCAATGRNDYAARAVWHADEAVRYARKARTASLFSVAFATIAVALLIVRVVIAA